MITHFTRLVETIARQQQCEGITSFFRMLERATALLFGARHFVFHGGLFLFFLFYSSSDLLFFLSFLLSINYSLAQVICYTTSMINYKYDDKKIY
jgi:hypothetical protein